MLILRMMGRMIVVKMIGEELSMGGGGEGKC
jgi:hypothetical protein